MDRSQGEWITAKVDHSRGGLKQTWTTAKVDHSKGGSQHFHTWLGCSLQTAHHFLKAQLPDPARCFKALAARIIASDFEPQHQAKDKHGPQRHAYLLGVLAGAKPWGMLACWGMLAFPMPRGALAGAKPRSTLACWSMLAGLRPRFFQAQGRGSWPGLSPPT